MRSLRRIARSIPLAAVLLAGGAAAQNSIGLAPATRQVVLSTQTQLELEIDFADPAIGGGIVIDFDPAMLTLVGFAFDAGFPDDPSLRLVCPSAHPACADFPGPGLLVAFAVDTLNDPPIQGTHSVGTLTLDSLAPGITTVTTAEDDSVAGPIVGTGSFSPPSLGSSEVTVTTPAPALSTPGRLALAALVLAGGALARRRRPHAPAG